MLVRRGLSQFDPLQYVRFGADVAGTRAANMAVGPSWCSWMPFAKLFDACYPTTPLYPSSPGVPNVSMTQAPASGEEAAAAAQAVSNKQITDWQATLQSFYTSAADTMPGPNPVLTWWDKYGDWVVLAGLGIGVIWAGKRI